MPARHPQTTFDRARELRAAGSSCAAIAEVLGVSPAWVSKAVRDVSLSAEQHAALHAYRKTVHVLGAATRAQAFRARRGRAQAEGHALARAAPVDFIAGCMLHWAEGSKDRNTLSLTNADPVLLRYWVDWMDRWFHVRDELAIAINCHLGNGVTVKDIEEHWCARLDVPPSSLRKTMVNRPSSASKGVRRPLVYGTVTVSLHSTAAVQLVYGAIQEHVGFDRPEWLDMGTVSARAA